LRAFIAVDISNTEIIEKVQQDLVADTKWLSGHFTPVRPQNLHFTLFFLGTIGFEIVEKVKMILSDIEFETINLALKGVGGFPRPEFARVIWVGLDEGGKSALVSLAAQIVLKLSRINITQDRPFKPHLTIFRARSKALELRSEVISKYYNKTIGCDTIDRVYLKQSELTSSGPKYSNIFTVQAK